MQRNLFKINEIPINTIALKARLENTECGYLWKKNANESNGKWQLKWFVLYQNILLFYENVNSTRPTGLVLLESSYCDRDVANSKNTREGEIKLFCFSITFSKDGKNPMEFGAETEHECIQWIEAIKNCNYNKLVSQNAELHEKYVHLSQMYETESKTKWQYISRIEELSNEVKELREQLKIYKKQHYLLRSKTIADEESPDLKRIKKVQSLCRGWLYRRRWKRIVDDYIKSPDAVNLRKRNRVVFTLTEREGEYLNQLEILVSNFLRPFKMAACSNKPPITHDEINCIYLNSEILLFLHQLFYKGLTRKLENWPTIFIGDLFDFLLPVLNVYTEYVRNHHYSLQILTELKSKSLEFRKLLKRYEDKPVCEGRTLDVFLTYPMHQIPRYILILHELISHTNHNSVNERKSLENAKSKLEELSKIMHDEMSETENIRCNLAIEKMIVDGCDCLLDANQVFIKEGLLILIVAAKSKTLSKKIKDVQKRYVVKCILFSNNLLITTRGSNGKLHLFKPFGVIPLSDIKIVEEINELSSIDEENASINSDEISGTFPSITESTPSMFSNDKQLNDISSQFRIIISKNSVTKNFLFIASSMSEKQSWCSDISQCIDNLNYSSVLQNTNTSSAVNMPNATKHVVDPKLFNDDNDVKYCKSLNSCKVPQIRYASLEKLFERLIDLRFLSIDFLNTFLLTYRVFTDSHAVLDVLIKLYRSSPSQEDCDRSRNDLNDISRNEYQNELSRRVSYSAYTRLPSIDEERDLRRARHSCFLSGLNPSLTLDLNDEEATYMKSEEEEKLKASLDKNKFLLDPDLKSAPIASSENIDNLSPKTDEKSLSPSTSCLTKYIDDNFIKSNSYSDVTTHETKMEYELSENGCLKVLNNDVQCVSSLNSSPDLNYLNREKKARLLSTSKNKQVDIIFEDDDASQSSLDSSMSSVNTNSINYWKEASKQLSEKLTAKSTPNSDRSNSAVFATSTTPIDTSTILNSARQKSRFNSASSSSQIVMQLQQNAQKIGKKISDAILSPRFTLKFGESNTNKVSSNVTCGVIITSARPTRRRTSNTEATKLFAIATSGFSGCDPAVEHKPKPNNDFLKPQAPAASFTPRTIRINSTGTSIGGQKTNDWVIVNTAASMRVLNVLRHWVTKYPTDFDHDARLKQITLSLLEEMLTGGNLTQTEEKVANTIIQQLNLSISKKRSTSVNLEVLLAPPSIPGRVKFSDLSVSEIAEQMTFIDYQIFCAIQSEELLGQAWMKPGKEIKAPNVLLFSKRFNEISQLVVTEIVSSTSYTQRLEKLEKWTTIASICRFLKNFNGVLQIMSAFATTSVFRLKKTWEKLSKSNQQTIDLLQNVVSSDGRFRNLREAMHKCDPPCIPYLGMYLMDLVFIEESTPDFADGLINFSKLRMISHIIREIRTFQNSKYTIHHNRKVCEYLTDTSNLLSPDEAYDKSLILEPQQRSFINTFESDA